MTLVVAGYKQNGYAGKTDGEQDYTPNRQSGAFVIADSMISNVIQGRRKPLVSGFKKIKEVHVKVWQPHLVGELFQGYKQVFQEHRCLIAFAGSTLTAQHVVDTISGHLSQLRIDYVEGNDFRCVIRKSCDNNNLSNNGIGGCYDDDIFIPERDYQDLLTADYISEVVEHSINKGFESKMKHVLDKTSLIGMSTNIILVVDCPVTRIAHIYKYKFQYKCLPEGGVKAYCEKEFIEAGNIAVIGMEATYGEDAVQVAKKSMKEGLDFKERMTDFVVDCAKTDITFEIGMPVVLKELEGVSVKKLLITDDDV